MFTLKVALGQALYVACEIFNLLSQKPENSSGNPRFVFRLYLYKRLILIGKSIFGLLSSNNTKDIDFTSIVSLTRTFILAYKAFDYLFIERVEDSEYELRKLLFQAYDLIERIKMIELLVDCQKEKLSQKENELEQIKKDIKNNAFFQKLGSHNKSDYRELYQSITNRNPNQRGYGGFSNGLIEKLATKEGCLKSDSLILIEKLHQLHTSLIDIDFLNDSERTRLKNRFDCFYKYLSNYIHVSAFSLGQQMDSNFSINPEIEHFLKITISACIFYLYTANNDILNLFPSIANKNFIKEHEASFKGANNFIKFITEQQDFI